MITNADNSLYDIKLASNNDPIKNLDFAIYLLEKYFKVPKLFEATDMVENLDEKSLVTYMSLVIPAIESYKTEKQLEAKNKEIEELRKRKADEDKKRLEEENRRLIEKQRNEAEGERKRQEEAERKRKVEERKRREDIAMNVENFTQLTILTPQDGSEVEKIDISNPVMEYVETSDSYKLSDLLQKTQKLVNFKEKKIRRKHTFDKSLCVGKC